MTDQATKTEMAETIVLQANPGMENGDEFQAKVKRLKRLPEQELKELFQMAMQNRGQLVPNGNSQPEPEIDVLPNGYPASGQQVAESDYNVPAACIDALQKFKMEKTFKRPVSERAECMRNLVNDLVAATGVPPVTVEFDPSALDEQTRFATGTSGMSSYNPANRTITMRGKLSIITLLHEFGHALSGHSEVASSQFSLALFKAVYPKQFEKLNFDGHMALSNKY